MLHKVFSPVICIGFGVWGTLGSGGLVGRVILVLRTFPELVCRSEQNLVEMVQRFGHERGTQVHKYIGIVVKSTPVGVRIISSLTKSCQSKKKLSFLYR